MIYCTKRARRGLSLLLELPDPAPESDRERAEDKAAARAWLKDFLDRWDAGATSRGRPRPRKGRS